MEHEEKKDEVHTTEPKHITSNTVKSPSLALGPAIIIGAVIIAGAVFLSKGMPTNTTLSDKGGILSTLDINEKKFKACYDAKTPEVKIRANMASAEKATKHIPEEQGRGTPYSVAYSKKTGTKVEIAGAYPIEAVKGMIDGLLDGKSKGQPEIDLDPVTEDDHYFGSKDAEIVIVEYSDLECPFCARFHGTMHQVVKDYNGKVAWVYRHLPLEGLHPNAFNKALSSECVYDLGGDTKFWMYIDSLFKAAEPKKPVFDPITGETK